MWNDENMRYVSPVDLEAAEASYICGTAEYPTEVCGVPMRYIEGPGTYVDTEEGWSRVD